MYVTSEKSPVYLNLCVEKGTTGSFVKLSFAKLSFASKHQSTGEQKENGEGI